MDEIFIKVSLFLQLKGLYRIKISKSLRNYKLFYDIQSKFYNNTSNFCDFPLEFIFKKKKKSSVPLFSTRTINMEK